MRDLTLKQRLLIDAIRKSNGGLRLMDAGDRACAERLVANGYLVKLPRPEWIGAHRYYMYAIKPYVPGT